ncbi:MAG: phosphate uptake regulator PhoU [Solirubrobacteraceae bacterium]
MRLQYQAQLDEIERGAYTALDIAVAQADRSLDALEHQDVELATFVIDDGARLKYACSQVQDNILSLLALQSPVAGDLRLVVAIIHVMKHVERIGDQCVNVAKLIPLSGNEPPRLPEIVEMILRMGHLARDEVVQSRHALTLRDGRLAVDIRRRDQELNELNRGVFRKAVDLGNDVDTREWLMTMTMVARAFERMGDNAVDIGSQVELIVDGPASSSPPPRAADPTGFRSEEPGDFGDDASGGRGDAGGGAPA